MKRCVWLCLFLLFAGPAFEQHRGGGAGLGRGAFGPRGFVPGAGGHRRFRGGVVVGGFGLPSQGFFNLAIPPVGPIPPLGINSSFFAFDRRFGFHRHLFSSSGFFPYAPPLVGGGFDYGYSSEPNVIIIQQPAPQMIVQPKPRETARPEIHNYKESPLADTAAPPTAEAEEATFVIALNDGSHHSANVVWVQDNVLQYIDSGGKHHQVPVRSVDRESTRKLNHERGLDFWLPAPH